MRLRLALASSALTLCVALAGAQQPRFLPGGRVLLDAHNAYPEKGRWHDRIDRALATGLPVAIEQDLAWCEVAPGRREPVVSHEPTCEGGEPTLAVHLFERIRPVMEAALQRGPSADWPLITLNLDFKTDEPEHHAAVWALLGRYEGWLTTAPKTVSGAVAPLTAGPLLVLTGSEILQERTFNDLVPRGARLRVFGAIDGLMPAAQGALPRATPATNYRRWWNHAWRVIEPEGQNAAGDWTADDDARLRTLVDDAHGHGLWIRVYTLNGHAVNEGRGWNPSYNFGTHASAERRWQAARAAGVDFIATDQYEAFADAGSRARPRTPTTDTQKQ